VELASFCQNRQTVGQTEVCHLPFILPSQRPAAAGIQFALTCNDIFAEMLWAEVDREPDEDARSFQTRSSRHLRSKLPAKRRKLKLGWKLYR
jgi:hypothetical protein